TPFRRSERPLGEHHVEPSGIELSDQLRADADLHLELHAPKERGEATECQTQRAPIWRSRGELPVNEPVNRYEREHPMHHISKLGSFPPAESLALVRATSGNDRAHARADIKGAMT